MPALTWIILSKRNQKTILNVLVYLIPSKTAVKKWD